AAPAAGGRGRLERRGRRATQGHPARDAASGVGGRPRPAVRLRPGDARRRLARSGGLRLGVRGPPRPRPGAPRDDRTVCCAGALADRLTARSVRDRMATGRETDAGTAETEQPKAETAPAPTRKRGRPKGSKNAPAPSKTP